MPLISLPCTWPLIHRHGPGFAPFTATNGMAISAPLAIVPAGILPLARPSGGKTVQR